MKEKSKVIIYASKTGATEKCSKEIANNLSDVKLVNIEKESIDIENYDIIIIGTPIRVGMIHKKIKEFININFEVLMNKKVCYFICCGFAKDYKKYYEENISKALLDKAVIYTNFGGELDLEKQKGLDKFIVKMINKHIDKDNEIKLIESNIEEFIKVIKELN